MKREVPEETLAEYAKPAGTGQQQFLRAADISKPVTYTIKAAEFREIKGTKKLVLLFNETDKILVVNKTNAKNLAASLGDIPISQLAGHRILLASMTVDFKGQPTKGLRIVSVE